MSQAPEETAKPKSGLVKGALWGVALLGVAAVVYIMAQASINPRQTTSLKSLAKGEMAKLSFPAEAGAPPATSFQDADGKPVRLADFQGKVLVVNMWATWCGPCIIEMPTLAKLAAEYQGQPVAVVAVSIDGDRDADKARQFIAQHAPLAFYRDPKLKLPYDFKPAATGMPTTVIFGKDGVERARLSGGADWSGADAKAVIDKVLAES
ncbi:TlpA family protein disulfide reductase [Phenylobacterium sp. 20VBR1]|uniref:TlpA family protein disulfide reductase n=1 Tax=Phenylobacterium glaciei TaxID=2803784 RepID=A0A941HVF2_9CAUL|nr:TlpA disulfide reductase family protein [Phenylobacterium glaciei]MBR7618648.1 TlpA family protein disulfide reductase [Phenylobacterium glaciei]